MTGSDGVAWDTDMKHASSCFWGENSSLAWLHKRSYAASAFNTAGFQNDPEHSVLSQHNLM